MAVSVLLAFDAGGPRALLVWARCFRLGVNVCAKAFLELFSTNGAGVPVEGPIFFRLFDPEPGFCPEGSGGALVVPKSALLVSTLAPPSAPAGDLFSTTPINFFSPSAGGWHPRATGRSGWRRLPPVELERVLMRRHIPAQRISCGYTIRKPFRMAYLKVMLRLTF
jgi:hypothetical protein